MAIRFGVGQSHSSCYLYVANDPQRRFRDVSSNLSGVTIAMMSNVGTWSPTANWGSILCETVYRNANHCKLGPVLSIDELCWRWSIPVLFCWYGTDMPPLEILAPPTITSPRAVELFVIPSYATAQPVREGDPRVRSSRPKERDTRCRSCPSLSLSEISQQN